MLLQSSNHKLDYYNRMQDLEDRLRRSEDERMSLRRQFDLLLQSNHEKERARVSAVEARYKRFLDEDRRRRDRNSSLLQALDRIDSHTASLAAKTERMRALRKHYETFLAHAYPGWNTGIDRSYCPLAAIAPAPNVMTRVTEVTGYDSGSPQYFHDPTDYSETQYHTLPSKPFSTLATPLCRSELSLSSREDYPGVGRSLYRSGSAAVRSASLSPTRVRELASADGDKITPLRHYDFYSQAKSPDVSLKKESYTSKRADTILSPNPPRFHNDILEGIGLEKQSLYNRPSTTNHRFMDYSQGNSDVEADQNTSGDLLNISNLSLADDYILNDDSDIPKSPPYSGASQRSYSPRDHGISRKSPSVSLFTHDSARQIISPREIFVPKRSALSSAVLTHSPKSILSPRNRKIDLSSSPSSSESVHRNLLPTENLDSILSPRRQKLSWQTLRPSYFPPAPRSPIRRSVTFTEPEYDNLYMYRDDGGGLYSGSYGSLRRHSPSTLSSPWESSDHERFLRDKHGREKDAFREKIERLKELIQENKVEDVSLHDDAFEKGKTSPLVNHQPQEKTSRENSVERDWKMVQSRRSSLVGQLSFDNEDQVPSENNEINSDKKLVRDFVNEDLFSDTVSDKEQWSGQFSEKDEDISEKDVPHVGSEFLSQDLDFNESSSFKSNEILEHEKNKDSSNGQEDVHKMEEKSENHLVKESLESYSNLDQLSYKPTDLEPEEEAREQVDYNYDNQVQSLGDDNSQNVLADESISKDTTSFALKEESQQGQENPPSVNKSDSQSILHGDQKTYADHDNMLSYEDQPQQQQQKQLRQDWSANEADASQNMKFSYDQEDQLSSTNYDDEPNQSISLSRQEGGFEQYVTDDEKDQQSYKTYQSNDNQQPQVHGDYVDSSEYKSYGETQQTANSGGAYQTYSEDPNQYQEPYETFSEDQQYEELQDQNYTPQDQNNYQYSQDPNKTQYKYEGQDYNYQQGQDDYNYSRETTAYQQEPTYQQDALYQQDQTYQQDPSYQPDQSYIQDQNYQQDDQYKQPIDYQQDQAYQDIGYEGTQQYGGYQQRTDDYSEDTSPSVDSNYQGQFQGNESANPKDLKDYHALLGADSNSEPAYSDSSELEKQMAAVVGETGSSIKGLVEPQVTPPPPSTPPVVSGAPKGRAGTKKKPQLTRKQSSITPDSADVKQQQSSTLPKVSETGQGASQHQNESDTSSSR